jgi:outer membrane murein-binding lipoprotein Lpp
MKKAVIYIAFAGLVGSLMLASCSPSTRKSTSVATSTQQSSTVPDPGAVSTSKAVTGTLEEQARAAAKDFWAQRFSSCGDSSYGRSPSTKVVLECKGANITINAEPVSDTEKLEGIEWKGATEITARQSRFYRYSYGYWDSWGNGLGQESFKVPMKKRNGRWEFYPASDSTARNLQAVECSQAPKG